MVVIHDPTDNLKFDEPSAFPSPKPAPDASRPPERSRKQRGWYQIHTVFPLRLSLVDYVLQFARRPHASSLGVTFSNVREMRESDLGCIDSGGPATRGLCIMLLRSMKRCGPHWLQAAFWLCSCLYRRKSCKIPPGDFPRILALVQSIFDGVDVPSQGEAILWETVLSKSTSPGRCDAPLNIVGYPLEIIFSSGITQCQVSLGGKEDSLKHIDVVNISQLRDTHADFDWMCISWANIHRIFASSSHLREMLITIESEDSDNISRFMNGFQRPTCLLLAS